MDFLRALTDTNAAANKATSIAMYNNRVSGRMMYKSGDPNAPDIPPVVAPVPYKTVLFELIMVNGELDKVGSNLFSEK